MVSGGTLVVIGAGMHAQRVIRAAQASGVLVIGCLDEHPQSRDCCGIEVFPLDSMMQFGSAPDYVVAIGNSFARQRLDRQCTAAGWRARSVIHPFSWVSPDAQVEVGSVVLAGAVIEANTRVSRGVIVDLGVIIDHEAVVGEYCHLRPGTIIHSRAEIGSHTTVERPS